MSAHTPGPWEAQRMLSPSENDRGWRVWAFDGIDGSTWIADVSPVILSGSRGEASDEGHANVALIAAAPDLYEALKELVEALRIHAPGSGLNSRHFDALGIKCNAALAKAQPSLTPRVQDQSKEQE